GSHDVAAILGGIDGSRDGARPVGCRDAGGHALARLDGDGEGGSVAGLVARRHQRQAQLMDPLAGQRQTDKPAAMLGHEIDRLGRGHLGRDDEIALVFAGLVVHQDEHAAIARLFDDGLGGRDQLRKSNAPGLGLRLFHARSLSMRGARESARRLISRLTRWPGEIRPKPVSCRVTGMILTPNVVPSTSLTVSDTPSTAMEPLGAINRANASGALKRNRKLSPSGRRSIASPTPSTWPKTRWPPSSSPSFNGRSRLT